MDTSTSRVTTLLQLTSRDGSRTFNAAPLCVFHSCLLFRVKAVPTHEGHAEQAEHGHGTVFVFRETSGGRTKSYWVR